MHASHRLVIIPLALASVLLLAAHASAQVLKPNQVLPPEVLGQAINPLPGVNGVNGMNGLNRANGLAGRTVRGYVGNVRAGKHGPMLTLRFSTRHRNLNNAAANGVKMVQGRPGMMFQITPQTKIAVQSGALMMPATLAALRPGSRITLLAVGQVATGILVQPYVRSRGGYAGHRQSGRRYPRSLTGIPNANGLAGAALAPNGAVANNGANNVARHTHHLHAKQVATHVKSKSR